jgi:hypothetical protein
MPLLQIYPSQPVQNYRNLAKNLNRQLLLLLFVLILHPQLIFSLPFQVRLCQTKNKTTPRGSLRILNHFVGQLNY